MATLDELFTGWGNLVSLIFTQFLNPLLWIALFIVIFVVCFLSLGVLIRKLFDTK